MTTHSNALIQINDETPVSVLILDGKVVFMDDDPNSIAGSLVGSIVRHSDISVDRHSISSIRLPYNWSGEDVLNYYKANLQLEEAVMMTP